MSERYDPFGRPIDGDHPWAKPAEETGPGGLPGGFLPPESPTAAPVSAPVAPAAPVTAPELPSTAAWSTDPPRRTGAPAGAQFATWGSRVGAYIVDAVVELVIVFVLALVAAAAVNGDTATGFVILGAAFVVGVVYPTVLLARWNGQTVGKRAMGIRVVGEGGAALTLGQAAMREIVMRGLVINVIGSITFGIVGILDVLWPLWDKENRSLHDHGADTWVVRA